MTAPGKANTSRKKKAAPYYWFQGASVRTLVDRLNAADPDTARLEVRVENKKMTFRVVASGADPDTASKVDTSDINDSFLCPPRCP